MNNAQKVSLTRTLNEHTIRRSQELIDLLGAGLPCSVVKVEGSIVTVKFEVKAEPFTLPQVKMPLAGSEYVRLPIQEGCKGVALSASARLGGMSGLGEGVADLTQPANLSAMVFFPIGNTGFGAPKDPKKIELYGPDGAIIRNGNDTAKGEFNNDGFVLEFGNAKLQATASGIIMSFSGNSITVSAAGISFQGPIIGIVAGGGGIVDFGANSLKTTGGIQANNVVASAEVAAGSIGLVSHHHTAPSGGGPTTPSQP